MTEMDSNLEHMLRNALDIKQLSDELDRVNSVEFNAPHFRENQLPEGSLLKCSRAFHNTSDESSKCISEKVIQCIDQMDTETLARLELEIQPEEILRDYLTLPDMQQIRVLVDSPPPLIPNWELPPLDFELVLDRDPFSKNSGAWGEIETSGFEMDCRTSGDLTREPSSSTEDFVFGSNTQMPFAPGGMEDAFSDRNRLSSLTVEELEKGQQWVKHIKSLPVLPPKLLDSANADFQFDDSETSLFSSGPEINGLTDIMDEREMGIIKKLLELKNCHQENAAIQQYFRKDMQTLLSLAGYSDIHRELNPDEYFDNLPKTKQVVKMTSISDSSEVKDWAIKVDLSTPIHDFRKRIPNMAHKYPFELDTFQKQAVVHLENHESVFVAAHTSAGKTVVAEYAIALSLRAKSRCVYTSPIKALSNQKYRDFKKTFHEIGLLTGDVQIEPNALCLVMTTEILRSMLYRGSELVRDLDWVIFDEVHYINDSERGVVWEEILIMLPAQVGIVMLSATVPNAMEFANWIGRIKQRKIFVITTLKRPVPLEHHLYVCVGSKTIDKDLVIVDTKSVLQSKNHAEAIDIQKAYDKNSDFKLSPTARLPPKQDQTVWLSFMAFIRQNELMPLIAFVFSRNRCDELGQRLSSLDMTSEKEKHRIRTFFQRAISRLNSSDRELPQIRNLEYLLERGVGVHHSGVLPILKEAVEMLFQEGLVKVLFATETFAMGVNMPARTVVFDTIRKHDGTEFRDLLPGEYIQMSGRAGRRGLDKTGTVFILCKMARVPDLTKLNHMILGVPTKLVSQFRLTYGMILHLLRIGTISILDMMKRSFSEHKNRTDAPEHEKKLSELMDEIPEEENIKCSICNIDITEYCRYYNWLVSACVNLLIHLFRTFEACKSQREYLNSLVFTMDNLKPLAVGRVVTVQAPIDHPPIYGIIVGTPQKQPQQDRFFDILQFSEFSHDSSKARVIRLPCTKLVHVLNTSLKVEGDKIVSDAERAKTNSRAKELFQDTVDKIGKQIGLQRKMQPLTAEDFRIGDFEVADKWSCLTAMEGTLSDFKCVTCPDFNRHVGTYNRRIELLEQMRHLQHLLSNNSLRFLPEYQQRLEVLQALQYVTASETITLRGRVACEISTTESDILVAECLFENVFTELEPEEIAALLSGLVFQGKTETEQNLPDSLKEAIERMRIAAHKIGYTQRDAGMKEAPTQLGDQLNFGLAEVVYHWCLGTSFVEIASMTDVQEGIIVRTMTRLDEVCRDVKAGAKVTGITRLVTKMELAEKALKRDIAFIGSLYVSD